ncbi:B12-binding domain-containing radical SAM protein [Desulfonauticus submarinus]
MPKAMRPKWPKITWSSSHRKIGPYILGINPWIYDFAAYNLWSRPVGLLVCLDMLREAGANIALLDCMDKTWQDHPWPKPHLFGKGHYPKRSLPKPFVYLNIPRKFSRYGLSYEAVKGALQKISPYPDLILITSIMTYWYPGVVATLNLVRDIFPKAKVVLGGIYATLCFEHAQQWGFDSILKGPLETPDNWSKLWELLGISAPSLPKGAGLKMALDLYRGKEFSILLGSRGCPFNCEYCASRLLYNNFQQKEYSCFIQEFENEFLKGVRNFAFYDDALLVNPQKWLIPFLKYVIKNKLKIRLHTPNAMHVRYLNRDICKLFYQAGLTTIRLGLETANFNSRLDKKLTKEQWERGLSNLFNAGFKPEQIGAYILFGLPGQTEAEIKDAIFFVKTWGIQPDLAYFTPIPHTSIFEQAKKVSPYPLSEEPLFQNNSIWPCVPGGFSWEKASFWKSLLRL